MSLNNQQDDRIVDEVQPVPVTTETVYDITDEDLLVCLKQPSAIKMDVLDILIEKSRERDQDAFKLLMERCKFIMLKMIHQSGGEGTETVEDIRQKTMLEVWKALHTLYTPKTFFGWLASIVRNVTMRHKSKEAYERKNHDGYQYEHSKKLSEDQRKLQSDFEMELEDQKRKAEAILAKLPPDLQAVYKLYYLLGESYAEVGRQLNLSAKQVKRKILEAESLIAKYRDNMSVLVLILFHDYRDRLTQAVMSENTSAAATSVVASTSIFATFGKYLWSVGSLCAALPFMFIVWMLSAVVGFFTYGAALVEKAQSPRIRRWHTWNNFVFYNLLLMWWIPLIALGTVLPHQWLITVFPIAIFVSLVTLIVRAVYFGIKFLVAAKNDQTPTLSVPDGKQLSNIIQYGFIASTALNIAGVAWLIVDIILWEHISVESWMYAISAGVPLSIYHYCAYRQFRRFLALSDDSMSTDGVNIVSNRWPTELRLFVTGMVLTIGPGVIQLLNHCPCPFYVALELFVGLALWGGCYYWINHIRNNKPLIIGVTTAIQVCLIMLVLQFAY